MSTLLLRCVAPLQSWDTQSNFGVRTSGREPSKSGIIGLLCAALGRRRTEPIDDLAALQMGVRVDREGGILRDWHTAGKGGYFKASGKIERKNLITSTRYYLSDAMFLIGLQSDNHVLLTQLHAALNNPYWMLFFGRKSCPPSMPVYLPDGLQDEPLRTALKTYEWLGIEQRYKDVPERVRIVLEEQDGVQVHNDHPLSFEKGKRKFAPRRVTVDFIEKPMFRAQAQVPRTLEVHGTSEAT